MQKIRTATFEDLDAIAAVEAACFPAAEAATKEEFAGRLTHYADHFWLLFEDEKLVSFVDGFVTDTPDLTDEMYADASLRRGHRRHGPRGQPALPRPARDRSGRPCRHPHRRKNRPSAGAGGLSGTPIFPRPAGENRMKHRFSRRDSRRLIEKNTVKSKKRRSFSENIKLF